MSKPDRPKEYAELSKALVDVDCLKILGVLVKQPGTVAEIAAQLGISEPEISGRLDSLVQTGVLRRSGDSRFQIDNQSFENIVRNILASSRPDTTAKYLGGDPTTQGDPAEMQYERKVLRSFLTTDGRIRDFPAQEKKFLVILRYVLRDFVAGQQYPEKQVNEILSRYNADTATLRRSLVDYGLLARQAGVYWRIEPGEGN